jgi:hypothetical protein
VLEDVMLMIREVMYCKPGKVRPMVEKFLAMSALMEKKGLGRMRVLTDVSAERYWTIVAEFDVESMDITTWSITAGARSTRSRADRTCGCPRGRLTLTS